MPCRRPFAVVVVGLLAIAACGGDDAATTGSTSTAAPGVTSSDTIGLGTVAAPSSTPPATTVPSTRPATTAPAPTAPATTRVVPTFPVTVPPTEPGAPTTTSAQPPGAVELGRSVEGRPITLVRRGTPGGTPVLIIGVIHGNEAAGTAIVDDLLTMEVPAGIELFVVPSMNPDGQTAGRRTNANLVDLNRNFPASWGPLGEPGDGQYAGTGPASEPETQVIVELVERIEPALLIWYHQDLFRIAPAKGRAGRVRQRYADLTGLPVVSITGGTYTGTAAGWARRALPRGVAFIVELGPTLSDEEARTHATAVLTVARELPSL